MELKDNIEAIIEESVREILREHIFLDNKIGLFMKKDLAIYIRVRGDLVDLRPELNKIGSEIFDCLEGLGLEDTGIKELNIYFRNRGTTIQLGRKLVEERRLSPSLILSILLFLAYGLRKISSKIRGRRA